MSEINLTTFKNTPYNTDSIDMGIFQNSLKTIDANYKEAIKTKNAIKTSIASLDMDSSEDEFKQKYADDIINKIDSSVEYGNFGSVLPMITQMAADVASDPRLLGRVQNNILHKQNDAELDKLAANGKITEDTADFYKEINPYHYEDKIDDNGNVTGFRRWTPNETPVDDVDFVKFMEEAKKIVEADSESGTGKAKWYDNGEIVDQWSPTAQLVKESKYGRTYISKEKLMKAVEAVMEGTPGAAHAIDQKFRVTQWVADKAEKQGDTKSERYMGDKDYSGRKITNVKDFIAKSFNPFYIAAQMHRNEYEEHWNNYKPLENGGDGVTDTSNPEYLPVTTTGETIVTDITQDVDKAASGINNSILELQKLYPHYSKTPQFYNMFFGNNLDFDTIKKELKRHNTDKTKTADVDRVIRNLENDIYLYNSFAKNSGVDRKKLLYKMALDNKFISQIPQGVNPYVDKRNDNVNKLFKYTNNGVIGYEVQNEDQYTEIVQNLRARGIDNLRAHGITESTINGNKVLNFKSNCDVLDDFISECIGTEQTFAANAYIIGYDKNGNLKNRTNSRGDSDKNYVIDYFRNLNFHNNLLVGATDAARTYNSVGNQLTKNKVTSLASSIEIMDNPHSMKLYEAYKNGGANDTQFNSLYKKYKDDFENIINVIGGDQFKFYSFDSDRGAMYPVDNSANKMSYSNEIKEAFKNDRAFVRFAVNPINGNSGIYVTVTENRSKLLDGIFGNSNIQSKSFFIENGAHSKEFKKVDDNTKIQASAWYFRAKHGGPNMSYTFKNGESIKHLGTPNMISTAKNGQKVDENYVKYRKKQDLDLENLLIAIDNVRRTHKNKGTWFIGNTNTIDPTTYNDMVNLVDRTLPVIFAEWGINPNTYKYAELYGKYHNQYIKAISDENFVFDY
jgi:hypothetical protein